MDIQVYTNILVVLEPWDENLISIKLNILFTYFFEKNEEIRKN